MFGCLTLQHVFPHNATPTLLYLAYCMNDKCCIFSLLCVHIQIIECAQYKEFICALL